MNKSTFRIIFHQNLEKSVTFKVLGLKIYFCCPFGNILMPSTLSHLLVDNMYWMILKNTGCFSNPYCIFLGCVLKLLPPCFLKDNCPVMSWFSLSDFSKTVSELCQYWVIVNRRIKMNHCVLCEYSKDLWVMRHVPRDLWSKP